MNGTCKPPSGPQPSTGRDELFNALREWVENGKAPNRIDVSASNGPISLPICMYPAKPVYNVRAAESYTCR